MPILARLVRRLGRGTYIPSTKTNRPDTSMDLRTWADLPIHHPACDSERC